MTDASSRIDGLRRRGEAEREALAGAVEDIADEIERRRTRWKVFGAVAGGAAAAGAIGWKLFGPGSSAARIGKAASAASVGLGIARGLVKLRRFI
jgi:hypothetical protein